MSDDRKAAGLRERLAAAIGLNHLGMDCDEVDDEHQHALEADSAARVVADWLRDEADRLLAEDTEPAPRVHGAWALRDLADTLEAVRDAD